jgi:hypothetical protein
VKIEKFGGLRKVFRECSGTGKKIEVWMRSNASFPGVINHEAALNNAVAMGATRESALAALP